jgi:hypothetical protein
MIREVLDVWVSQFITPGDKREWTLDARNACWPKELKDGERWRRSEVPHSALLENRPETRPRYEESGRKITAQLFAAVGGEWS